MPGEFSKHFHQSGSAPDHSGDKSVEVKWDVGYDDISHDVVISYELTVIDPDAVLHQVSAKNEDTRFWHPEDQPRISSIFQFASDQKVTSLRGALIDAKWRKDNSGDPYLATIFGLLSIGNDLRPFGPFEKRYTFPPKP